MLLKKKLILQTILILLFLASLIPAQSIQTPKNMNHYTLTNNEASGETPIKFNIFSSHSITSKIDPTFRSVKSVQQYIEESSNVLYQSYKSRYGIDVGPHPVGLLVKLGELGLSDLKNIAAEYGGTVAKYWRPIDTALVVVPGDNPRSVIKLAREVAFRGASYVVPDSLKKPMMWDAQYIFNMRTIWENLGLDGTGVTICILDTGVDPTHPAIPNPAYWKDFINNNTTPYDDHGHGTHVAGIALGRPTSIFPTADYMWHSVLASDSIIFNPPVDWANLTYKINISDFGPMNVSIILDHMYVLYENYSVYGIFFKAEASVWVSFDNTTWTKVADFRGNQTTPVRDSIPVSVPDTDFLYIRFALNYLYQANGSYYDISDWDILGWFINEIMVNLSNTTINIYMDKVDTPTAPVEVVQAYYWARVKDAFSGMAPNATLAAGKVCGTSGCPDSAILDGMNWSLNVVHANIVSMSLGGPTSYYDPLAEMADYLVQNGVLVVIAAGNEGPYYFNVSSPGISRLALTVAAATKGNTIAYFSSPGPSPVGGWVKPDVAGIGYEVISSITSSSPEAPPWVNDLPYTSWGGTSMATPMVAGLAALVMQAHPTWNASMIKQAIIASADWLNTNGFMSYQYDIYKQGAGMIDPHQVINMTVVPKEANIFLGNYTAKPGTYITYNITILNTGTQDALLTVSKTNLYQITTTTRDGRAYNFTSLIMSPNVGDTFVVPAGGSVNVTLRINLSDPGALIGGYYGGHVLFNTNTSGPVKVIFGAFVKTPTVVKGQVLDYYTKTPLANVNVSAISLSNLTVVAYNITDANGSYMLVVPVNVTSFVIVANYTAGGYHTYVSYNISGGGSLINLTINLMPFPAEPTILVIAEVLGDHTLMSQFYYDVKNVSEAMGFEARYWDPRYLGRPVYPIVDNVANDLYPVIIYTSGGSWDALWDPAVRAAMKYFVNNTHKVLVLSGGDIGWYLNGIDQAFFTYVLHANYTDDLFPDNYTIPVYNMTPLATVLGFDNFIANLGSSNTTLIGNLTIMKYTSHYPDRVDPTNNGVSLATWYGIGNSSIVAYYGNGSELARTLYFAFDLYQLPEEQLDNVLSRIIAWATDVSPPTVGNFVTYKVDGSILTVLPPDPANSTGIYDPNILGYKIWITPADTPSTIIAEYYTTSLPYSIDLSGLGLTSGQLYSIHMSAWDTMAKVSTLSNASVFRYFTEMTGDFIRFTAGATLETPVTVANGGSVKITTTGAASIQLVEIPLDSVPALPPGLLGPGIYRNAYALDLYTAMITPESVNEIVLTLNMPSNFDILHPEKVLVMWWNGTAWVKASHYTVDTENMTLTIVINSTTSPTPSNLTGTPIILVYPVTHIGGMLLPTSEPVPGLMPIALVGMLVVVGASISIKVRKKQI